MNVFKEITTALGWLSGSLAGIAALFFSCGYLITRAHMNLLGVSAIFSFTQEQYMLEGARFVADMVDRLARNALPLLELTIMLLAAGFLLGQTRLRGLLEPARLRASDFLKCRQTGCRAACYGLLLLLLFLIKQHLAMFGPPLAVSDLLFLPAAPSGTKGSEIAGYLLSGDRDSLESWYFDLTLCVFKAALLLLLAWRLTQPWRLRLLLTAPFALAFSLSVLLLPMSYGVLKRPVRFPSIVVNSENSMLASVRGELFLLDKTEDQFILWEAGTRRVLWLPRDQVLSAQIGKPRLLFASQRRTP